MVLSQDSLKLIGIWWVAACIQFLQMGVFSAELNETVVVLIPKKGIPEVRGDLRPIALYNVVFKIMTKMVANSLNNLLSKIISES